MVNKDLQILKEEYPFKSHFLDIDGNPYHYIDEGEGEVLLMVHGNPTWSFYYRNLVKKFSKHYRVIVPDHMGCGLSGKPQNYDYTLRSHINNLTKLIKFLDLRDINLFVHDWGGAIGFGAAVEHKELFKRAVIFNTAAFHIDRIPFRIGLCRNKHFGEFLVRNLNGFAWPATFMASKKRLSPIVKKGYLLPYNNVENRIAVSRFVQDIPMEQEHPTYKVLKNIEEHLRELSFPKMILWGGKDFCFNDLFYQRWLEIYPSAFHKYYKDAGHYVIEDEKEDIIKNIESFLQNT